MGTGLDTVLNEIQTIKTNVARSFEQIAAMGGTVPVGAALADMPSAIRSLSQSPTGGMPGLCLVTFKIDPSTRGSAYIPAQGVQNQLLVGAKVRVYVEGGKWEYAIVSISRDAEITCMLPVTGSKNAVYDVVFGAASENVIVPMGSIALTEGANRTVELVTALVEEENMEVGRLQRLDQNVADSYPIVRRSDASGTVVESFGHFYKDSGNVITWVNETGVANYIPEMTDEGVITTTPPETRTDYETTCFPWKDMKRVKFTVGDELMDIFATECPLYYVKDEVREITFRTVNHLGVETTATANCRIWWVCKKQLSGYYHPSWNYKYVLTEGDVSGTFAKSKTLKAAHYMPCYKTQSATISSKTCATSRPFAGVAGGQTRMWINDAAHNLNSFSITIEGSGVFDDGTILPADSTNRRFAGGTWQEHHAFRFLQYIQYGVDVQSAMLGFTENHGGTRTYQNAAEACFTAHPEVPTFSMGSKGSSNPIVWMWILNPWGNEGEQMVDATVFAERTEDNTTRTTCLCMLDRSRFDPHGTVKATMLAAGYEQLSYLLPTGSQDSHRCGRSEDPDYAAFQMPTSSTDNSKADLIAVQDYYWISGHPGSGSVGAVARMCSLSNRGGDGRSLGPWCVYANSEPSVSIGANWGARLSLVLSAGEGGAAAG